MDYEKRLEIVENHIMNFDSTIKEGGRNGSHVKYKNAEDLYKERTYLKNQIAKSNGKARIRRYGKNGGRGYV